MAVMKKERTTRVQIEMSLSFEVQKHEGSGKDNFDIASESAVSALRGYLARYPYGRVESITRTDQ